MIDLILFLALLALGYGAGTWMETSHYRSIGRRERSTLHLPAVTLKSVGVSDHRIRSTRLVYGSAVISVDYFKRILAGLRNIFGGSVKSYESLIDRARREALLRMKAMAGDATVIVNVRIETSAIGKQSGGKTINCLEALAYGTALTVEE
ncbi:MAG: heavy metal-binding domain-containing protein [Desulfosarcina sp.]